MEPFRDGKIAIFAALLLILGAVAMISLFRADMAAHPIPGALEPQHPG